MTNTIKPTSVNLEAKKAQIFETSFTWLIDPASIGDIDVNGLYTSPDNIETKKDVHVLAKDEDGKEIGKALITLLPEEDEVPTPTAVDSKAVIKPSTVWFKCGQKQQFSIPISWTIEPANAPGKIDATTGEYLAPNNVAILSSLAVVASNCRGEELGRSIVTLVPSGPLIRTPTVTPVPSDPPIRALTVRPETAELKAGQQLAFSVDPRDLAVTWQTTLGNVENTGVYTAPEKIVSQQTIILTAKSLDGAHYGNATITLSNATYCTRLLSIYWIAFSTLLTGIIIYLWPSLTTSSHSVSVFVNPPIVTMGQQSKQQFTAEFLGVGDASKKAVTWMSSDGSDISSGGVYTPKADAALPGKVQITATSKDDPSRSGNATVYLTKDGSMAVLPSSATLQTSQTIKFTVVPAPSSTPSAAAQAPDSITAQPNANNLSDVKWSLSISNLGEIDSNGLYTAPPTIERPHVLTVLATNERQDLQAAANITLLGPQSGPEEGDVIFFVILMGMLGSVLHSVMSFTVFVGSRAFAPSWSWWYIFRPFVGGSTALFFFFLVGLGKISEATVDPKSLGLVCGLVGLFSDTATRKLAEIFNVILGTKEDLRGDKLPGEAPKTTVAAASEKEPPPTISGLSPEPVKEKDTPLVTITGTNFREGAIVRVKSVDRKSTYISSTSLVVQLTQEDTADGEVEIVVINTDGTKSNTAKLSVSK